MKKFLIYGEYAIEKRAFEEFRNDFKVLGIVEAKDLDEAKEKLIDECGIDDINDIEGNEVHIVEIASEVIVDLENI